jgi:hypothetical protein
MSLILMPNALKVVLDYLRPALAARTETYAAGVAVGTKYATEPKHIQVRPVGGSSVDFVHAAPRLDFIVRHTNDFDRDELGRLAYGLVFAGQGPAFLRVQSVMLPTPFPDPADSSKTVVMFTVQITMQGSQVA